VHQAGDQTKVILRCSTVSQSSRSTDCHLLLTLCKKKGQEVFVEARNNVHFQRHTL